MKSFIVDFNNENFWTAANIWNSRPNVINKQMLGIDVLYTFEIIKSESINLDSLVNKLRQIKWYHIVNKNADDARNTFKKFGFDCDFSDENNLSALHDGQYLQLKEVFYKKNENASSKTYELCLFDKRQTFAIFYNLSERKQRQRRFPNLYTIRKVMDRVEINVIDDNVDISTINVIADNVYNKPMSTDISTISVIDDNADISTINVIDDNADISTINVIADNADISTINVIDDNADISTINVIDDNADISTINVIDDNADISTINVIDDNADISTISVIDDNADISTINVLDDNADISTISFDWLFDVAFPKFIKWAKEDATTVDLDKSHQLVIDSLMSVGEYNEIYSYLKDKYAMKIIEIWPEVTDPCKFVYEDVAIASYLLVLWKGKKRTFADLGCGNGLLVYILNGEGHNGFGVDIRKRKIWSVYENGDSFLKEGTVTPDSRYPDCEWIIGNHSDELTPWIPTLASLSSYNCNFIVIPCCSYELNGRKFVRRNSSLSAYQDYLIYVKKLSERAGFVVEIDKLRIPSTKRTCLIGRARHWPENEYHDSKIAFERYITEACSSKTFLGHFIGSKNSWDREGSRDSGDKDLSHDSENNDWCRNSGNSNGCRDSKDKNRSQNSWDREDSRDSGNKDGSHNSENNGGSRCRGFLNGSHDSGNIVESHNSKYKGGNFNSKYKDKIPNCKDTSHYSKDPSCDPRDKNEGQNSRDRNECHNSRDRNECHNSRDRNECHNSGTKNKNHIGGDENKTILFRSYNQDVRNCTQVDKKIVNEIVDIITKALIAKQTSMSPDSDIWSWDSGIDLSETTKLIASEKLLKLKGEFGGLKTLLRNHRYIFKIEKGRVLFRKPDASLNEKRLKHWKTKVCWFYSSHPLGCVLLDEACSYIHSKNV